MSAMLGVNYCQPWLTLYVEILQITVIHLWVGLYTITLSVTAGSIQLHFHWILLYFVLRHIFIVLSAPPPQ